MIDDGYDETIAYCRTMKNYCGRNNHIGVKIKAIGGCKRTRSFGWTFYGVITKDHGSISPQTMLKETAKAVTLDGFTAEAAEKLKSNHIWELYLDENGNKAWDIDAPEQIQSRFTIQDVAQFSKSYLADYPVFVSGSINRAASLLRRQNTARANWISGVSHDIRTPLSVIMGYAELLNAGVSDAYTIELDFALDAEAIFVELIYN